MRHKASPCEAALDIPLSNRGEEGRAKAAKELELTHVVNIHLYQVFNLATVRLLQRPKAANIEWLKEVRRMQRHIECDDVVLLAMELEFGRMVALVAVKDQQPIFAFRPRRYIAIEVLDPI